ncbi:MAG TPA: hypothetical protein VG820_12785 [Fimbriimonadaceae bacterium]|nr:hypothetical protein [Fimbriimonadaceae bacterium]
MYELLLLIGGIGFLAMAAMGMMHGGGGGHGHSGGHGGLSHGHGPALAHGHGPGLVHGHGAGHAGHLAKVGGGIARGGGQLARSGVNTLLSLLSPMDLFAMAAGAGATGLLLQGVLAPHLLPWAAVAGALAAEFLLLKPAFALLRKFVTNPSEGIEGSVDMTAQAITRFDAEGKGLVQFTLDEQIVQLLAVLEPAELELGEGVSKGDQVTVVSVDPKRNRCVVSKLNLPRNP